SFDVTSPGSFYDINGQSPNPTITVTRGVTYTFDVNTAADHPFEIVVDQNTGVAYNDGVVNNNISTGTITFTVPQSAPDTLYYICSIHFFFGVINVVGSPNMPPQVSITNPANGTVFINATSVVVQATATDSDGSVTN